MVRDVDNMIGTDVFSLLDCNEVTKLNCLRSLVNSSWPIKYIVRSSKFMYLSVNFLIVLLLIIQFKCSSEIKVFEILPECSLPGAVFKITIKNQVTILTKEIWWADRIPFLCSRARYFISSRYMLLWLEANVITAILAKDNNR